MIRTAIACFGLGLYTLLGGPPLLLYTVVTGEIETLFRAGREGIFFFLRLVGVRLRVEGLENIPPGACLFAANHTSYVDPPLVTAAIPGRIAILLKKSIFAIPIVGTAFRLAHFVPMDRANTESALASLDVAAEFMKQGTSYLIYPEGTRSPDGRLLPFKRGAFVLAIKAGVPVVPVACVGAHRILPKKSLRMKSGEVIVRFCAPVDATVYTSGQRGELAERVHAAIAAALPADQRPLAASSSQPAL